MREVVAELGIGVKRILFATDFSGPCARALPYALSLAQKYDAKLLAAHVKTGPLGVPLSLREGLHGLGVQPRKENCELDHLDDQLQSVRHEVIVRKGDVWSELSDIVRAEEVDLIVTGTHGRTGAGKLLMGSVAETIFRHAPCPVLTVGPAVSGEPASVADLHEILFPTDFSAESVAALPYALSFAEQDGARLYLLYVAGRHQQGETLIDSQLRNLVPRNAHLFCAPKAFVETGPPAECILALAEELGTDLIVLGVKRAPAFFEAPRHLPQATAYRVVSEANCPVLTVRG